MLRSLRFMIPAVLGLALSFTGLTAQATPPDTVVLTGAPLGPVTFVHVTHQTTTQCVTCHHASRPEKPASSPFQPCTACHTATPEAPMTTSLQAAFHDARGQSGLCIACHIEQKEAGKAAPVQCPQCHVRPK
jgi:hypothetical protein